MSREGGASSTTPEDVSWHQSNCTYRKFVEHNKEACLLTDKEVREELEKKYKRRLSPASKSTRRRTQKLRQAKVLTPEEETAVNNKVDQALDQDGPIRWYLESQQREMQEIKARLKQECDCIKEDDATYSDILSSPEVQFQYSTGGS